MCKALLPIGNEPMISYVLTWLEQAGIIGSSFVHLDSFPSFSLFSRAHSSSHSFFLLESDVLILTPASYYSALSHHLQSFRQSQIQNGDGAMKINLQAVKGSAAGSEGESDDDDDEVLKGKTADLLREYKDSLSVSENLGFLSRVGGTTRSSRVRELITFLPPFPSRPTSSSSLATSSHLRTSSSQQS